jgi:CRISPR-associated endonuclease Cas1
VGLWLSVRAGELALQQRDGAYTDLDRRLKIIVAAAHGFCVTSAAIRHCSAKHIVLISDDAAAFVSLFAPEARGDTRWTTLKVRERQFRAAFDPTKTVAIAKAVVAAKFRAEGHRREAGQAYLAGLQGTKTVDNIRHIEAQAAQIWWQQLALFKMRFAGRSAPAEWRSWPGRYIGRRQGRLGELAAQFTARNAVHPMQAMLNFSIGVVAARMARVVAAHGLDAAFGFLHDGRKPGRLSLVWDCVELHRPKLVSETFEYAAARVFERMIFG